MLSHHASVRTWVRERLDSDDVFCSFYSGFLELSIFPVQLFYNSSVRGFQRANAVSKKSTDKLFVQVLQAPEILEWIASQRSSYFMSSSYYLHYYLCKALQSNIKDDCVRDKKWLDSFLNFLQKTAGERSASFWLDAQRLSIAENPRRKLEILKEIAANYLSVEADYDLKLELEIAVGLTMPTISEEKVKEAQEAVLTTIRKYWVPRFLRRGLRCPKLPIEPYARPHTVHGYPVKDLNCEIKTSRTLRRCATVCEDRDQQSGPLKELENVLDFDAMTSGDYFHEFLKRKQKKIWINSYLCWMCVKELRQSSSREVSSNTGSLLEKAKLQLRKFLAKSGSSYIGCSEAEVKTAESLLHASTLSDFIQLVDYIHGLLLKNLAPAWHLLCGEEAESISKVPTKRVKITKENPGKMPLPKLDVPAKEDFDPFDPSLCVRLTAPVFTFDRLVHNCVELDHFRLFLSQRHAVRDLALWLDIEEYLCMPFDEREMRSAKSWQIKTKYLHRKYFFGHDSPASLEIRRKVIEDDVFQRGKGPSPHVLLSMQECVRERIEKRWLPIFTSSDDFKSRQMPRHSSMAEVVEAIMSQRRWEKRQGSAKSIKDKWAYSSKDFVALRKALCNPVTCMQFRNYVSIKNDDSMLLENDILFWLEAQKYCDLCKSRCSGRLIKKKARTIVNRFMMSSVPPSLQITIRQDLVDEIVCRMEKPGPLTFREAQDAVFQGLYTHWLSFCEWKSRCLSVRGSLPFDELEKQERVRRESGRSSRSRRESEVRERAAAAAALGDTDEEWSDEEWGSSYSFKFSVYEQTGKVLVKKAVRRRTVKEEMLRASYSPTIQLGLSDRHLRASSITSEIYRRQKLKIDFGKRSASVSIARLY
ncbi:regulator of G-protein signaling 22-like isoform X2 [Oscarella lobularis]|uniref:regulator of G-protein signaling 22-like isoform X2 n=1 Tax=Oscarella lobularis TaxID=121494 RepID=UPI0033141BC9